MPLASVDALSDDGDSAVPTEPELVKAEASQPKIPKSAKAKASQPKIPKQPKAKTSPKKARAIKAKPATKNDSKKAVPRNPSQRL